MERNALRTRNASFQENAMFLHCYGKLYCLRILSCYVKLSRVLVKRQLESRQRQLERTATVKAKGYTVSIDKKTTVYKLEAWEIAFFENVCLAVHSNALPYFTDLPVSSRL